MLLFVLCLGYGYSTCGSDTQGYEWARAIAIPVCLKSSGSILLSVLGSVFF